jgi:hypothetical protein
MLDHLRGTLVLRLFGHHGQQREEQPAGEPRATGYQLAVRYRPGNHFTIEAQFDPNCHPFPPGVDGNQTGWTFRLGQGYQNSAKVNNLSTVTQPLQTVTTQLTNGSQPAGSVTLALNSTQVSLAQNHNLWVQGAPRAILSIRAVSATCMASVHCAAPSTT